MNNRGKQLKSDNENKKSLSIVGFILSITLLSLAIFLSIKQEKMDRLASVNEYTIANNTRATSSEISRGVNEVLKNQIIELNQTKEEKENIILNENTTIENNNQNTVETTTNIEVTTINENTENENTENNTDTENNKEENDKKKFIMPIEGEIYKEYSMDSLVYSETLQEWVTHRGIDIQVNNEEEVKACADGTVKSVKNDPRYGWSVIIEHKDGLNTIYTCLKDVDYVKEGEKVEQGQVIGKAGNSGVFESADGSHLHFEMTKDGGYINPEIYIK